MSETLEFVRNAELTSNSHVRGVPWQTRRPGPVSLLKRSKMRLVLIAEIPYSPLDFEAGAGDDLQLGRVGQVIEVSAVAGYPDHKLGIFAGIETGVFQHIRVEYI